MVDNLCTNQHSRLPKLLQVDSVRQNAPELLVENTTQAVRMMWPLAKGLAGSRWLAEHINLLKRTSGHGEEFLKLADAALSVLVVSEHLF